MPIGHMEFGDGIKVPFEYRFTANGYLVATSTELPPGADAGGTLRIGSFYDEDGKAVTLQDFRMSLDKESGGTRIEGKLF